MYKYFAFISFHNSDAREALRLQHGIERYRLPAILVKHDRSIPRRVRPLYCYLNDMHAKEELMQELKPRMEQSRYLIVVCSPRSARSVYVNSGIDYFVSLGRRDSIIPVIVDGIPYSGDEQTECFPEALRRHFPKHADPLKDHSILGINIHEQGAGTHHAAYNRAMLMLVARMLQLDYDGLLLRDRERRRKRLLGWGVFAALGLATLAATWIVAQPVSVSLIVEDASPHNAFLPLCENIELQLTLPNESKCDTLKQVGDTLIFRNIPSYCLGKSCRVQIKAPDYHVCDTTVTLQRILQCAIWRDETIFGSVRFTLYGHPQPETITLMIAGQEVRPDAAGRVSIDIPITQQRVAYGVHGTGQQDTIYMPCGEDDVLVWQP